MTVPENKDHINKKINSNKLTFKNVDPEAELSTMKFDKHNFNKFDSIKFARSSCKSFNENINQTMLSEYPDGVIADNQDYVNPTLMTTKNLINNSNGFYETNVEGDLIKNDNEKNQNDKEFEVFYMKLDGAKNKQNVMQTKHVKTNNSSKNKTPENCQNTTKDIYDLNYIIYMI